MKVIDVVEKLGLRVFSGHEGLNREVSGGYTSDLLSDVMGHAPAGAVWITVQTHRNVIAIASLRDLPAVILSRGEQPAADTTEQSNNEGIAVLGSELPTFTLAGKLYAIITGQ